MTPLVSVLMPALNAETTIESAIRSALEQTHRALEVLVVDDGSTDKTLDVARGLGDPRVHILESGVVRSGPSAARNRAIAQARGEFVACLDADDLWMPEKLALQIEAIRQAPGAAVSYGWTDFMDGDGLPIGTDLRATTAGDVHRELLVHNFIASGSNSIMLRSAVAEVGGFDEALGGVEDWDLHVRLARRHRIAVTPHVVVRYRRYAGSQSTRTDVMEACWRRVAQREFTTPELRSEMDEAAGRFFEYLAGRALEGQRGISGWPAAARYGWLSMRHNPPSIRSIGSRVRARLFASV